MHNSQTMQVHKIIPSMYGTSELVYNFAHFFVLLVISVLLNSWCKVWGNSDIIFPKQYKDVHMVEINHR